MSAAAGFSAVYYIYSVMKSITCHNERKLLAGTDPGSRRYCTSYICLLLPTWYWAPGEGLHLVLGTRRRWPEGFDLCSGSLYCQRTQVCKELPHFEVGPVAWGHLPHSESPLSLPWHHSCQNYDLTLPSVAGSLLDPFMCPFLPSFPHCHMQRTQQTLWELLCCSDPLPYAKTVYQTFDCSPNWEKFDGKTFYTMFR